MHPPSDASNEIFACAESDVTAAGGAPDTKDGAALSKLLQQQRVQHRAALSRLRKQWGDQQTELRQQKQAVAARRAAATAEAKAEAKRRREAKQRAEAKEEQIHLREEAQERVRPSAALHTAHTPEATMTVHLCVRSIA